MDCIIGSRAITYMNLEVIFLFSLISVYVSRWLSGTITQ